MTIEYWDIDRPKPYPKNARKWSAKSVEKVAASIREFGWRFLTMGGIVAVHAR